MGTRCSNSAQQRGVANVKQIPQIKTCIGTTAHFAPHNNFRRSITFIMKGAIAKNKRVKY